MLWGLTSSKQKSLAGAEGDVVVRGWCRGGRYRSVMGVGSNESVLMTIERQAMATDYGKVATTQVTEKRASVEAVRLV